MSKIILVRFHFFVKMIIFSSIFLICFLGNAIYGEKIKFDDRVQKVPISNDGIYEYAYTSKGSRNDVS